MRTFALLAAVAGLTACEPSTPPLHPAFPSAAALATAVVDGFASGDAGRLSHLALSEQEFRQRIWPELPAARPERNLPFSYVWGDLRQKSRQSVRALLAAHRGRRYTLISVRFGAVTPYQTFTVHRGSVFVVRGAGGATEVRLCGSMIEQDGQWKVFSFVVDD